MTWATALVAGSGVLKGVGAIQEGNAAAEVGKARQNELNIDAQNTKIAAEQSQSARLDELTRTVGTIRATVASRGLDLNSPSALALSDAASGYTQRDINRERFNAMQTASSQKLAGVQARLSGQLAQQAGYVKATGSLFDSASKIVSAGKTGGA